jgi:hypothetical protein
MAKKILLLAALLVAAMSLQGLFAEGDGAESQESAVKPLIERSVTQGFFGIKGSYFDPDGNRLEGKSLITFLQSSNDPEGAKRVEEGIGKVGLGQTLYWLGLITICISPLSVDYSASKHGKEIDLAPFMILIGAGSVSAFGGIVVVKQGNDDVDSAVIGYNSKVKKGTLSFAPKIRDDGLTLAVAYQY